MINNLCVDLGGLDDLGIEMSMWLGACTRFFFRGYCHTNTKNNAHTLLIQLSTSSSQTGENSATKARDYKMALREKWRPCGRDVEGDRGL